MILSWFRIAFRNTGRQKKRTSLLAGAIAFGVAVVTLLNGFTGGVSRNVEKSLTDVIGGHVYVSGAEVTDSGLIVNVIRENGESGSSLTDAVNQIPGRIGDLNRRSSVLSTLVFGSKQTNQFLEGVDWFAESNFLSNLSMVNGAPPRPDQRNALILPESTAKRLQVSIGDQVLARLGTVTGQQNVGEFILVAEVEDSGMTAFAFGFARLDYLGELIGTGVGEYQLLTFYLRDPRQSNSVAKVLRERLPTAPEDSMNEGGSRGGNLFSQAVNRLSDEEEAWEGIRYEVSTIDDQMAQISDLFNVLNIVSLSVFLILLTITMVGVVNTFRMVLLERIREIGTMRAVGMQRGGVRNIFLMEACFIGMLGALAGLLLAGVVILVLGQVTLQIDSPVQFFLDKGRLTFVVPPQSMIINVTILLVLSVAAAFIPARRAAKMDPAAALRSVG